MASRTYKKYPCKNETCSNLVSRLGRECRGCYDKSVRNPDPKRQSITRGVMDVLEEQAKVAPELEGKPRVYGEYMLLSDPHVPFHDPKIIHSMVLCAMQLGLKKLLILGDLIHADTISQYDNAGKTVEIVKELDSAGKVLRALEQYFDEIVIIVGNHDQRIEKLIAKAAKKGDGNTLRLLASSLGVDDDPESISHGIFWHYFGSPKITFHMLPEIILNDTWLLQHPGTCSRQAAKTQKDMIHKWRMSVVGGHNHLQGLTFDDSGKDIAYNIGPSCDDTKFRYVREKPGTFPRPVSGFAAILQTPDNPGGRLLPLMIHDRYFDLHELAERLKRVADDSE